MPLIAMTKRESESSQNMPLSLKRASSSYPLIPIFQVLFQSRRQNFVVQLGQALQCRNGVFPLTVFCTKNCIQSYTKCLKVFLFKLLAKQKSFWLVQINKWLAKTKTNLSFNQIKPARAIRQVFYIFAGPIHYKSHSTRPSENNINNI